MIYAQFYHESTGWNGTDFSGPVKLIPLLGTDGVFHLDARKTLPNLIQDARNRLQSLNASLNKGIKGLQIMQGNFSSAQPLTQIQTPA